MSTTESRLRISDSVRDLGAGDLAADVAEYCASPLFSNGSDILLDDNPYRRPLNPGTLGEVDLSRPLTEEQFCDYGALVAHRALVNIYESESILLPMRGLPSAKDDFELFYGERLRALRDLIRPGLEHYAYSFLEDSVDVSGAWTVDAMCAHFMRCVEEAERAEPVVLRLCEQATDARAAASTYLIQLALDGLTEASAMARNLAGAYGAEQSELFKIFIDEFGYGVHDVKHSTLFQKMMESCGLKSHVHAYWHFYLTGSLAVINYFNYLTEDHRKWFRYAGAVTYIEWIFAQGFANAGSMLRNVFGDDVDTKYTDEHAHIDQHHGRMTFENLLQGLARRHGDGVIPELVRGIEEIRLLLKLADDELAAQLVWMDSLEEHKRRGRALLDGAGPELGARRDERFALSTGDPFGTRMYDYDVVIAVDDGEVALVTNGSGSAEPVRGGEAVLVPKGRLHGLAPVAPQSSVAVRSV